MHYVFIGGGNMGRALAAALISKGVCEGPQILVVDPDAAAREQNANMDCAVRETIDEQVGQAPVVLLAVKPQSAPEMYGQLRPFLRAGQVVVSIMAGIPMQALRDGLGQEAIVRVMPNTPSQVGLGMSVYCASPAVTPAQQDAVEKLFQASGATLAVESEDAIDAATAVSGSGPAYVFFMAEHWMKAAERLGFSAAQAELLVQQTLAGATELWKRQGVPPSTLREQVTSKGGTTAAALDSFRASELGAGFEAGVERAYQRAKELGS